MLRTKVSLLLMLMGFVCAFPLRAQGVEPPPIVSALSPGGVNYQTGSYNLEEAPDVSIGGEGVDHGLQFARAYQSGLPSSFSTTSFGQGWTHNLYVKLSTFQRANPRGGTDNFISVSVGNKSTPFRVGSPATNINPATMSGAKLIYNSTDQTYRFTDRDGNVIVFDGFNVRTWTRPNGVVLTYSGSGTVHRIESSLGYALLFEGSTINNNYRWIKACAVNLSLTYVAPGSNCPTGVPSVTYSYSADGKWLTGVTNALNQTTEYQYNPLSGSSRLTCVKRPGQSVCEISNQYAACQLYPGTPSEPPSFHHMDRVMSQTTGAGVVYTYTYSSDPYCPRQEGPYHATITVGGAITKVATNNSGAVIRIEDPLGRVTSISYPATGAWYIDPPYPSRITSPEGNWVEITHQAGLLKALRQIAKPGLPSPDLFSENTYPAAPCTTPAICNKPIAVTDARQNVTNYSYWSHGGIWTEMPPAPVAGGARPLKVTTWVQRYAWLKDAGGSLVQNSSFPVWVRNTETQCQTLAGASPTATCDPNAPLMVTTYEYGANGTSQSLLVKGLVVTANGTSLRTCYGYDLNDRKIYETQPNANLSSCP